jgi:NADPH:quinone reductase-like Zn-dependent oxidoreductase
VLSTSLIYCKRKENTSVGLLITSTLPVPSHRLDPLPTDQPPFPFVGGAEFAGRISKDSPIPPDCPFKPGDRVFGSCQGAFAEKVATNWQQLFPIPKGMNYNEAAGLFVTWPTSYEALVGRAELKAGERTIHRLRERNVNVFT